jgi:Negative regulator of sigma F
VKRLIEQPTELLIGSLTRELQPVRPLRPPVVRALWWLAMIAALVAVPLLGFSDLPAFALRSANPRVALELVATLATGITAVVAAFYLSIPDRSANWVYAPVPPLLLWLGCSGLGCLQNGLGQLEIGCLIFVLASSLPLALLLFAFLRRARPIAPLSVALTGGLGVAGIAAFLLQFFHPFDVTVIDLGVHIIAVAVVVSAAATMGRRTLTSA